MGTHDRANRYSSRVGLFTMFRNNAMCESIWRSTKASADGAGPNNGSSLASVVASCVGNRTGSLVDPPSMWSDGESRFLFPVYGVTGGEGRFISD